MTGKLKRLITTFLTATMTIGFIPEMVMRAEEKDTKILFQDFESNDVLITNTSNSTGVITSEDRFTGENSLRFDMNGDSADPKTESGSIKFSSKNGAVDVTNSLKLKFKTKDTQGNNGYKISLVDINGNETNFVWADGPNGNKDTWTDAYISLDKFYKESPSVDFTQIVEVRFGQWNNGTYYLDDFYFDNALAETENKKENFQSFENNGKTFTTTNGVNGSLVNDEKFSGNSALKYERVTSGDPSQSNGAIVINAEEESVNASEYKYLVMRFKDTQGSNTMLVGIEDKFGNVSNFDWYDGVKTVQNEWIEYYIPMSFFSGVNKEFVSVVRLCQWNSGVYYIDDVYFTNKLDSEIGMPTAPTSNLNSGAYGDSVNVKLTASLGAEIYYTVDGTEPTVESTKYIGEITLTENTTLKAIAVKDNKASEVSVFEYEILKANENVEPVWFQDFEGNVEITEVNSMKAEIVNTEVKDGKNSLRYDVIEGGSPEKDKGAVLFGGMEDSVDVRGLNYLVIWIKDTKGANTMKVSIRDVHGNETDFGAAGWMSAKTKHNEWVQYVVPLSDLQGYVDKSQISEVRVGQWNGGVYYIDNVYFTDYLYKGLPGSECEDYDLSNQPVSTVESGRYTTSQVVELVAESGANIYYTVDGTEPTTESNLYTKYLTIAKSTTIKAIAVKDDYTSEVKEYEIRIVPNVVYADKPAGEYVDSVIVELRSKTENMHLYYTVDGTEPTKDSIRFYSPIELTEDTNIKAVAYNPISREYSDVEKFNYTIIESGKVQMPIMLPIGGTYGEEVSVKLASKTEDAVIYYTVDGTEPTTKSNVYDRPIKVSKDMIIKAIAVKDGKSTEVAVNKYKIEKEASAFLKVDGKNLRNNYGSGDIVALRGTNVGGWLVTEEWQSPTNGPDQITTINVFTERFGEEKAWELINNFQDNWWTEEDFDIVKEEGMNTLRLPITYFEMLNDDGSLKETAFDRLDWFLEEAAERELYVIVDMHGAIGSQNGKDHSGDISNPDIGNFFGNEENIQKTIYLWEEIAKRYVDNPWIAGYDLLNEPGGALGTEQFEAYDRIYDAIRAIDQNHVLFIQAIWEPYHLPNPDLYGWENVAYEYHFYGWDDLNNSEYQKAFIDSKVEMVNEMTNFDVPLLVGEYTFFENIDSWDYGLSVFVQQGWSFTSWTYKVHGAGSSWGMYTGETEKVDIYEDSYEEIMRKWSQVKTTESYTRNDKVSDVQKKYFAAEVTDSAKIIADNVVIEINSEFNPLDGVIAIDRDGSDITEKVEVISNYVNVNKAGAYTVVYSVVDNINRTETKEITVTVEDNTNNVDTEIPDEDDKDNNDKEENDDREETEDKEENDGKEETDDRDDIIIDESNGNNDDESKEENVDNLPETGDGYNRNIFLILGSLLALSGGYLILKKRKYENI